MKSQATHRKAQNIERIGIFWTTSLLLPLVPLLLQRQLLHFQLQPDAFAMAHSPPFFPLSLPCYRVCIHTSTHPHTIHITSTSSSHPHSHTVTGCVFWDMHWANWNFIWHSRVWGVRVCLSVKVVLLLQCFTLSLVVVVMVMAMAMAMVMVHGAWCVVYGGWSSSGGGGGEGPAVVGVCLPWRMEWNNGPRMFPCVFALSHFICVCVCECVYVLYITSGANILSFLEACDVLLCVLWQMSPIELMNEYSSEPLNGFSLALLFMGLFLD